MFLYADKWLAQASFPLFGPIKNWSDSLSQDEKFIHETPLLSHCKMQN